MTCTSEAVPPRAGPTTKQQVALGILLCLNFAGCICGAFMLIVTAGELSQPGERWGLLGVLLLGGPASLLMILLTVFSAMLASSFWRQTSRAAAAALVLTALLGAATNVTAVLLVFGGPDRDRAAFERTHAMYTSGLHDAVTSGNLARARAIVATGAVRLDDTDYEDKTLLRLAEERNDAAMTALLRSAMYGPATARSP